MLLDTLPPKFNPVLPDFQAVSPLDQTPIERLYNITIYVVSRQRRP
jgi:hypothetical protein